MNSLIGSLAFFFVFLMIDVYAYQAIQTISQSWNFGFKWTFRILFILACILVYIGFMAGSAIDYHEWPRLIRTYFLAIVMTFLVSKIFLTLFMFGEDLYRGGLWLVKKFQTKGSSTGANPISRSEFISQAGILAASVPIIVSTHGMVKNAYNYQVHSNKLVLPKLPASFNGFKIVQLSDIHTGSLSNMRAVEKGIEKVMSLNADMIVFTGDLVNDQAKEAKAFIELFSQLKAPFGVHSITGNHDYGDYVHWGSASEKKRNFEQLLETHDKMGWQILINENRSIKKGSDFISLIGIENWSAVGRFPKYGKLDQAYAGIESSTVKILLSHDPSHWDAEVLKKYTDIDLMLAGHTHGFQFGVETPFFRWSPVQYVYPRWAGLYQENNQYLYVNRGFGFLAYPGRVGILPEITEIVLSNS